MLSVAKVRRGRETYYLESTRAAAPDRPGLVEPDGVWWGILAEGLGLADRTVDAANLTMLLAGVDPTSGEALDPRHGRVTVAAFDCTFAAPKSVSVLHALGGPETVEQVRASHERAVAGALGYLERHAATVRRSGAPVASPGFAAASFLHRTSRAEDPHLHTHLVIANLAPDADRRWSAIDARPLFVHAAAAGALYRAGLRHEISRRLSVDWQTRAEGFADLIGIPAAALRGFSRRSAEIAAELARTGRSGPYSARLAANRTRAPKDLGGDYPTLVAAWRERAFSFGVSRTAVSRLDRGAVRGAMAGVDRDQEVEARVGIAADSLGRAFDRRELIRATCSRLVDGAPAGRVEAAVDAHLGSGEVVACGERSLLLRAAGGGRIPGGLIETRFETREVAALTEHLATLMDSAPVLGGTGIALSGVVGTDSETDPLRALAMVRAAALAAHERGGRVVGLAPDRRGAAHLEAATGIATFPFDGREGPGGDCLFVVANPDRCPVRDVVALAEQARAGAAAVLFVRGGRRSDRPQSRAEEAPGRETVDRLARGGALTRCAVAGVEVVLAADLAAAIGGIRLLCDERRSRGRRPLVVTVAPRELGDLGFEVATPTAALRRHHAGDLDLVVFGGARILGSGLTRVSDGDRAHVAVVPVDRGLGGEVSTVLEIAEPAGLRREIGRSPDTRRGRDAWRARARGWERRDRALPVGRGSGRDEILPTGRARAREWSRPREPTLSR